MVTGSWFLANLSSTILVSPSPGETLYHTDLGQVITGTNPFTGKVDSISHITDLLLYNNNVASVQFTDDSELTMVIVFR